LWICLFRKARSLQLEGKGVYIRPSIFQITPGVLAAVSTRNGGVSPDALGMNLSFSVGDEDANVLRNRELFFGGLGIGLRELAIPRQVHGSLLLRVRAAGSFAGTDGLVTDAPRVFLCVTVADCVPILLCDPRVPAVGVVHAGWRGTTSGILAAAVRRMQEEFGTNPATLLAFVGPAAGACCYEVGPDVAARFDAQFLHRRGEHALVDLKSANRTQLLETGLQPAHIEVNPSCTIHESAHFHSYRRDGNRSGRMMGVIGIVSPPRS
jgi:YfiH family protein